MQLPEKVRPEPKNSPGEIPVIDNRERIALQSKLRPVRRDPVREFETALLGSSASASAGAGTDGAEADGQHQVSKEALEQAGSQGVIGVDVFLDAIARLRDGESTGGPSSDEELLRRIEQSPNLKALSRKYEAPPNGSAPHHVATWQFRVSGSGQVCLFKRTQIDVCGRASWSIATLAPWSSGMA